MRGRLGLVVGPLSPIVRAYIVIPMYSSDNCHLEPAICGLCSSLLPSSPTEIVQGRRYHLCPNCDLLQMAPVDRLGLTDEKKRYLLHDNSIRTTGYTRFLERLILPVITELDRQGKELGQVSGLDFGSGPYPMLAELMAERGYHLEIYDPLFAPRDKAWFLAKQFDYIVCCETVEHFYQPYQEFSFLSQLLTPDGFIAIMTSLRREGSKTTSWHYAQDETHVALYSARSMDWIAEHFNLRVKFPAQDVIIFKPR